MHFFLSRWWLLTFSGIAGLIFELGWLPSILLGGPVTHVLAVAVAIKFHIVVYITMGLDFLVYWCPGYWVFLPDVVAVLSGKAIPSGYEALAQTWTTKPVHLGLALAYIGMQTVVAARMLDCRGKDCLPFTCCPMFSVPRNLFVDRFAFGVLTEYSFRGSGVLDHCYNFFPWHKNLPLTERDLRAMPGAALIWMCTRDVPKELQQFLQPSAIGKDLLVAASFPVPAALREALEGFLELCRGKESDWADQAKVSKMLMQIDRCHEVFRECHKLHAGHQLERPQAPGSSSKSPKSPKLPSSTSKSPQPARRRS
jgi:hypothetical protein